MLLSCFKNIMLRILSFAALVFLLGSCPAAAVDIVVQSDPTGQAFTVTGANCGTGGYTTPQTLNWTPGVSCTINFLSPHSSQLGTQYVFASWQDGTALNPRVIVAPAQATTYTANFNTQYYLNAQANPPEGGSVTGTGWYTPSSEAILVATANTGYHLVDWTPIAVAPPGTTALRVYVYMPQTVTANFAPNTGGPPTSYSVSQIATSSNASGLNGFGQVVGMNWANNYAAFLWTPVAPNATVGNVTGLGLPVSAQSSSNAVAINDRGQIIGTISPTPYFSQPSQMFLWSPSSPNANTGSTVSPLDSAAVGSVNDLNNFGQISGFQNGTYGSMSFLWTPTAANGTTGTANTDSRLAGITRINNYGQGIINAYPQTLFTPATPNGGAGNFTLVSGLPGATSTQLVDINSTGTVLGMSCMSLIAGTCNLQQAFLWTPTAANGTVGTTTAIALPAGFVSMTPVAINTAGQVVGTMVQSNGVATPFLYSGGTTYDLSLLSGALVGASPVAINDFGQIVLNGNGVFLLTPSESTNIPVPITINSVPSGITFAADGSTYSTPQVFSWAPATVHRIEFPTTVTAGAARLGFSSWADGSSNNPRNFNVPAAAATLSANYSMQYALQLFASPPAGGIVLASPASPDGFYLANRVVKITAFPNSAYQFVGFSGGLNGTTNGQNLTLTTSTSVTANFVPVQNPAIQARITNNVSKTAQPTTAVTAMIQLQNTGAGAGSDLRITDLSARIIAPAPGLAQVNKTLPLTVGALSAGASSANVAVPLTIPTTATRVILTVVGTIRNSAGTLFSFSTAVTILR
jgi:probable HAF family extracellular repeat protein